MPPLALPDLTAATTAASISGYAAVQLFVERAPTTVLDGLTALADQNLLRQEDRADGERYFVFFETIREYALERPSNQHRPIMGPQQESSHVI